MTFLRAICLSAPFAFAVSSPAELPQPEERLAAAIDAGVPGALALLRTTVDVNSGTMNFAGVREVGRLFDSELDGLGFAVQWVEGSAWSRAGHVVAKRPASRDDSLRLLLIGHLDTVFEIDSPFQRFEELPDSTARGPGVIDMKGGIFGSLMGALSMRRRLGARRKCGLYRRRTIFRTSRKSPARNS